MALVGEEARSIFFAKPEEESRGLQRVGSVMVVIAR
jgi:hypothetical protein